jgi:uncharacterized protein
MNDEFSVPLIASPFGSHKGIASGRPFFPDELGLPMQKQDIKGVKITKEGIAEVKKHLERFGFDPQNAAMIQRLQAILTGEILSTDYDIHFYTHELREFEHYKALGYTTGEPNNPDEAYRLWNNTHTATLEEFGLTDEALYHPDIL